MSVEKAVQSAALRCSVTAQVGLRVALESPTNGMRRAMRVRFALWCLLLQTPPPNDKLHTTAQTQKPSINSPHYPR